VSKSKSKSKRKNDLTEEGLMKAMTEMQNKEGVVPITDTPTSKPAPNLTSVLLRDVRTAALKASADTAHNIAELESWRNEIDATIAFHDSCYLGRYNGIMDAPRNVAKAVPGLRVVELPRSRERGLCCGGGGGHMWMEVKAEKRVNLIRVEEILDAKVSMVATGCPFCLAMIDLGRKVKGAEETLAVKDVSELVAESLP
jgi:Fe-S oxidoreductase